MDAMAWIVIIGGLLATIGLLVNMRTGGLLGLVLAGGMYYTGAEEKPEQSRSSRRAKRRKSLTTAAVIGPVIVLVLFFGCLYVVLSGDYENDTENWASGVLGGLSTAAIAAVFGHQ